MTKLALPIIPSFYPFVDPYLMVFTMGPLSTTLFEKQTWPITRVRQKKWTAGNSFSKEKGSLVTPKGIKPQHHVKVIPCCGKYNRWHRWHRWIDGSFETYWLPSLPPQTSIKSLPVSEIVVNSHCENAVGEKTYWLIKSTYPETNCETSYSFYT